MKHLQKLKDVSLLPVLVYIVVLIIVDNLLLQSLQSPIALIDWAAKGWNDPSLTSLEQSKSALGPGFPTWIDSFIWVVITLVVWFFKKKWVYVPLTIYTAWVTFWLILSVAMVSINLWNPHGFVVGSKNIH